MLLARFHLLDQLSVMLGLLMSSLNATELDRQHIENSDVIRLAILYPCDPAHYVTILCASLQVT